jgi:hypothetical protein
MTRERTFREHATLENEAAQSAVALPKGFFEADRQLLTAVAAAERCDGRFNSSIRAERSDGWSATPSSTPRHSHRPSKASASSPVRIVNPCRTSTPRVWHVNVQRCCCCCCCRRRHGQFFAVRARSGGFYFPVESRRSPRPSTRRSPAALGRTSTHCARIGRRWTPYEHWRTAAAIESFIPPMQPSQSALQKRPLRASKKTVQPFPHFGGVLCFRSWRSSHVTPSAPPDRLPSVDVICGHLWCARGAATGCQLSGVVSTWVSVVRSDVLTAADGCVLLRELG